MRFVFKHFLDIKIKFFPHARLLSWTCSKCNPAYAHIICPGRNIIKPLTCCSELSQLISKIMNVMIPRRSASTRLKGKMFCCLRRRWLARIRISVVVAKTAQIVSPASLNFTAMVKLHVVVDSEQLVTLLDPSKSAYMVVAEYHTHTWNRDYEDGPTAYDCREEQTTDHLPVCPGLLDYFYSAPKKICMPSMTRPEAVYSIGLARCTDSRRRRIIIIHGFSQKKKVSPKSWWLSQMRLLKFRHSHWFTFLVF